MDRLPIFLKLTDKPCLVIGGGPIAERKIRLLMRTGAAITVVSPELTPELQRLVRSGGLSHHAGGYARKIQSGVCLIVAATDDAETNRQIGADAERAGVFCNVVDDNAASSFILPAIVDRSPVVIAIGTEGTAPVLAQQLKLKIEAWLPARVDELAAQAGRWRDLVKKRFTSMRDRRRFWQRFFDGPIAQHLLANRQPQAEKAFRQELLGIADACGSRQGEGWIVGAGPGDPGLVTLRAQQLISRADVILYDRLVSAPILDFARKEADLISVGKRAGSAIMSQEEINELLVTLVAQGKRVCRLKGGDPFVFGRGAEEALALANAGLPFQIVPGISAALGCAAYAGIPLTLRGISAGVTLATAKLEGDASPKWSALLNAGQSLALYMGVGSLKSVSEQLIGNGVSPGMPVAIVENGTTRQQRTVDTSVAAMAIDASRMQIKSPAILFVGESAAPGMRVRWFDGASDAEKFRGVIDGESVPVQAIS